MALSFNLFYLVNSKIHAKEAKQAMIYGSGRFPDLGKRETLCHQVKIPELSSRSTWTRLKVFQDEAGHFLIEVVS